MRSELPGTPGMNVPGSGALMGRVRNTCKVRRLM